MNNDQNSTVKSTKNEVEQNQEATKLNQQVSKKKSSTTMLVKVYSPFRIYFDGPAFSISAENRVGPFDILPGHHNFMTLINACTLLIRSDQGDQKILISGGLMHVKADKVIVFLDV
jgi:F0F1-type ATP synthase epsilon subunit